MVCFIDYRTTPYERETLNYLGLTTIDVPLCNNLYKAIDGHVDIQLNVLSKNQKKVIINKDMDDSFKKNLNKFNISYLESSDSLKSNYPGNISLNALILDNYFIHNIKYTDKNLLESQKDKILINVKQGYTKCSCLPVSENALITSDEGIYKTLTKYNFDILLIPPGDIILDGLNYGFIGGTGGLISKNKMAFFGSLDFYSYGKEVKSFLNKYNIEPIYLNNSKLYDRGSLFVI